MDLNQENVFKVVDIVSKAPTRRKLYDIIQKVYDLPNFGTCISTEYLKELSKPDCKYLRVERTKTSPIPKGVKRFWNSIEAFNHLCKILVKKKLNPTGFTHFAIPNLSWMVRMMIFVDPNTKKEIFKRMTLVKVNAR